jgi:hypothetical protein
LALVPFFLEGRERQKKKKAENAAGAMVMSLRASRDVPATTGMAPYLAASSPPLSFFPFLQKASSEPVLGVVGDSC